MSLVVFEPRTPALQSIAANHWAMVKCKYTEVEAILYIKYLHRLLHFLHYRRLQLFHHFSAKSICTNGGNTIIWHTTVSNCPITKICSSKQMRSLVWESHLLLMEVQRDLLSVQGRMWASALSFALKWPPLYANNARLLSGVSCVFSKLQKKSAITQRQKNRKANNPQCSIFNKCI